MGRRAALMVAGCLVMAPGVGLAPTSAGAATGQRDLELVNVTIDQTGEQSPDKWTVGNESAQWSPSFGTANYSYALPSTIPARGTSVTIALTAHANPPSRFAPALGLRGDIVGGDHDLGVLAESGETKSGSKQVTLTPGSYASGAPVDVLVGLQDGPRITYHYQAVLTASCRAASACSDPVAANPSTTVPAPEGFTSYKPPAPGKAQSLPFPPIDPTETDITAKVSFTDDHGARAGGIVVQGLYLPPNSTTTRAVKLCVILLLANDTVDDAESDHLSDTVPSFTQCVAAVGKILDRHDKIIAAKGHVRPRVRPAAAASSCRVRLHGSGAKSVKIACKATSSGVTVSVSAKNGATLASLLGPRPRLIVSRSKTASKVKRVRVSWHSNS